MRPTELRARRKEVYVMVPRYAKSAGTLLACAADKVFLTPIAELGPIDLQIYVRETGRWISAKAIAGSLRQVIGTLKDIGVTDGRVIRELIQRILIVELGHYDSLIEHILYLVEDQLKKRMFRDSESKAKATAKKLVESYRYHGRVIHNKEAERIGIQVKTLEEELLKPVYQFYKKTTLTLRHRRHTSRTATAIREGLLPFGPAIEKRETNYGLTYIAMLGLVIGVTELRASPSPWRTSP